MKTTTCACCNAVIIKNGNNKYCSKECFDKAYEKYGRDRSRRLRGSIEYKRTCPICGQEFTTYRPHKMTCSDECKKAKEKMRSKERNHNPELAHKYYIDRKYGSQDEYEKYLEAKEEEKKRLREERKEQRKLDLEDRKETKICVVCGGEFKTLNPRQKTCSKKCGRRLANARKQKRIPKGQIIDNDITLETLYKRDSGVCYLCGKPCNWEDRDGLITGDTYPSIDHLIPVAKGGAHSWDNVRLAHFKCNLMKSDDLLPGIEKNVAHNAYEYKRDIKTRKKKTLQYDKAGKLIRIFESTGEAERETGVRSKGIQNCARGERKSYGGYVWKYSQA